MSNYAEKLRNPQWQKRRLEIFERDGFACRFCGNKEEELHCHHLSYGGDPIGIESDLLVTACKTCHDNIETAIKTIRLRTVSLERIRIISSVANVMSQIKMGEGKTPHMELLAFWSRWICERPEIFTPLLSFLKEFYGEAFDEGFEAAEFERVHKDEKCSSETANQPIAA